MATSTITTNPYTFNIVEDMIITPNVEADIPTGERDLATRNYRSVWNVTFTVPAHITVIRVRHWRYGYGGDERPRLKSGIRYGPGYGVGLQNAISGGDWCCYNNQDSYIGVIPGRTYTLTCWVDGFKSRYYGFKLLWSPSLNSHGISRQDNDYSS